METWSRRRFLGATVPALASSVLAGCHRGRPRAQAARPAATYRYGDGALQVVDLYLPGRSFLGLPSAHGANRAGVVVLIHGGYWQPGFDRGLMRPLVPSLLAAGRAVWNLDYRPAGVGEGGGWPGTFQDVSGAMDSLRRAAADHPLDLGHVVTVGHSAGGTLALWAAARGGLPNGAPGGRPAVNVRAAASLAGLDDLVSCAEAELGHGACVNLMGGQPGGDGRYQLASPLARLPLHRPQLLVHGTHDEVVPLSQSRAYARAAKGAGDEVTYLEVGDSTHMSLIDPRSDAWAKALRWVLDH